MVVKCGLFGIGVLLAAGCGHTEDEWQHQVRANDDLRTKLSAEQAKSGVLRAEQVEATARFEQLQRDLREAGVDPAAVKRSATEQARAMEDYSRRRDQAAAAKHRMDLLGTSMTSAEAAAPPSVVVTVRNNWLTVQIRDDVLFQNGRDALRAEGRVVLQRLAQTVRSAPELANRRYQVRGHVDHGASRSHAGNELALSRARAEEVASFLTRPTERGGGGLPASRWSAVGYGDSDPLSVKDTPEAHRANARCEIVLEPAIEETLDLRAIAP